VGRVTWARIGVLEGVGTVMDRLDVGIGRAGRRRGRALGAQMLSAIVAFCGSLLMLNVDAMM